MVLLNDLDIHERRLLNCLAHIPTNSLYGSGLFTALIKMSSSFSLSLPPSPGIGNGSGRAITLGNGMQTHYLWGAFQLHITQRDKRIGKGKESNQL